MSLALVMLLLVTINTDTNNSLYINTDKRNSAYALLLEVGFLKVKSTHVPQTIFAFYWVLYEQHAFPAMNILNLYFQLYPNKALLI